jgi:hypothetical protein
VIHGYVGFEDSCVDDQLKYYATRVPRQQTNALFETKTPTPGCCIITPQNVWSKPATGCASRRRPGLVQPCLATGSVSRQLLEA